MTQLKELKTQLKEHFLSEGEERRHEKVSFYPTESETSAFEIYHRFKGTLETNPMDVKTRFGLGMRKKLEEAAISFFDGMEILKEPEPYTNLAGKYIEKPDQHRVDMEKNGVRITGYMDGVILEKQSVIVTNDVPIEIKTSYGKYQQDELLAGKPKMSYLKQLAIYMDSIDAEKGYLFQVHFERDLIIDDIYQFTIIKTGDKTYQCNGIIIDLNIVYARYKEIWDKYIQTDTEPVCEFRYKYPLEEINWRELYQSQISGARNNKAVIGDWQVKYSSYKNLIIEKEGSTIGYSDQEIEYILSQTRGYTRWFDK